MTGSRTRRAGSAVLALAAVHAATFTYLSFRKHDAFAYARFDLGNMAQTVWNTARGRFLEMSDDLGETYVRLGVHVDPILAAFAPLYALWQDPKLLLLAQAVGVASGAWPAFRLARAELAELAPAWVPVALAGTWLAYPPLSWATLNEFHAVTLGAPLLLWAIWLLREGRSGPFAVVAVAAVLSKEQVGLLVAALGIYGWLVWGRRRAGLSAAALGGAWSVLAFLVVIPVFTPFEGGPFADRYEAVGGGATGIIGTLVTDPLTILSEATTERDLAYLAEMLAPLAFLALLAPAALLCALPDLAINLLSANPFQTSVRFHYVAGATPFVWWASLLGVRRLAVWVRRAAGARSPPSVARPVSAVAAVAAVAAVLTAGWRLGPLPVWEQVPGGYRSPERVFVPDAADRDADRAVAAVPEGAAVSVGNRIGGRLTDRRRIALFPNTAGSDWVVVDGRNASIGEANAGRGARAGDPGWRGRIASSQAEEVERLLASGRWTVHLRAGEAVVLRRVRGEASPR